MNNNNLRRDIKTFALTMTGLGSIIGSGWLFGAWRAAEVAGPAAIISWILGTLIILFIGLTYAELGTMFPESGGMVRYGQFSHGSLTGFLSGWANWIAVISVVPVEAEASVQYMSSWKFDWAKSLYNGQDLLPPGLLIAAVLVIIYFLLNYFTVKLFARVNTAITIFKFIIPGLTIIGLLITSFHGKNFTHYGGFMPHGFAGVFTAIATSGIVFAFNGFQSPINMAGEARNPRRSIPIAVIGSITLAGIIYMLLQIAFIGGVKPGMVAHGWSHIQLNSPFADLALAWGLNWLAILLFADAFVSPSGTGITYTATTARMIYGMEKNGHLPKVFGFINPKFGVPRAAMWLNLVVAYIFLFLFRGWGSLASVISVATLISYATGPVSLMVFRRHGEDIVRRPVKIKGMQIIAPIAFIMASLIYYWAQWPLTGKVTLLMVVGLPVYLFYQAKGNWKGFGRDLKAGLWLVIYLIYMAFISCIGSSKFHGHNIIHYGWDFIVVIISALIFYAWGIRSGFLTKELKDAQPNQRENEA